jgi:hypothetical protein
MASGQGTAMSVMSARGNLMPAVAFVNNSHLTAILADIVSI